MTFDDFLRVILESAQSSWRGLHGPTPQQYMVQVSGGGDRPWLEVEEHHSLWVLNDNIRISLAYGMNWNDRGHSLTFPQLPKWPDENIYGRYAEMRYDGNPIHRVQLITVDGGRAILPTPRTEIAPPSAVGAYTASTSEVKIARLVSGLVGHRDFERYFDHSGIIEIPEGEGKPSPS